MDSVLRIALWFLLVIAIGPFTVKGSQRNLVNQGQFWTQQPSEVHPCGRFLIDKTAAEASGTSEASLEDDWRIIGGKEVNEIGQFPWQVSFNSTEPLSSSSGPSGQSSSSPDVSVRLCSGVIVSSLVVLTAAHCVQRSTGISLRYASLRYNSGGEVRTISAKQIIPNPGYNATSFANDIALIVLSEPIWFRDSDPMVQAPQPICLPQLSTWPTASVYSGQLLNTAGWGRVALNDSQLPEKLRTIKVLMLDNWRCREMFQDRANLTLTLDPIGQVCASGVEPNAAICLGDSGAPLFTTFRRFRWSDSAHNYKLEEPRAVLVALASQTYSCGQKNLPDIYTGVGPYLSWIWYHIGQAQNL